MSFDDSSSSDIDDAATLVRSLMERLKHSSYYRDIPRVSCSTLDNLQRFDDLLAEASSTIRQYFNAAKPINRCPDEVLSEIFALSATETLPSFSRGRSRVPFVVVHKLLPLTMVCRSWRNIALGTPCLWSDVVLDKRWSVKLHSRYLALAKTVPLQMHARRIPKHISGHDILRMFEESGHSIRTAYLQLEYNVDWDLIIKSLPTHPLLLTHLTIDTYPWRYQEERDEYGKEFFGGLAPTLRTLCIYQVSFLPTDKFPNLTRLVVTGRGSFTLRIVLSVFSNMPGLQRADLNIEIETGSVAQCEGDPDLVVQLPHLRQFVLRDRTPSSITALLSMVKFASTCLVQIDEQRGCDLVSIAGLLHMRDFTQNLTRLRVMPHRFYNDGDQDNEINAYYLEFFDDAGTSGLRLGIREIHSGLWTAYDRTRVTNTLINFLSSTVGIKLVSNVRELWVHLWTDLVNDRLLAAIPPIHTLGLVLARPPYVRTAIPESIGQLTEDGSFSHCPDLTSLYVYTCDAEDVDRARLVATARKEAGCPLHRLAIECEQGKSSTEVRSQALELEGLVGELSVTVGEKKRAWWKPCAIPEGYGPCRWPEWH